MLSSHLLVLVVLCTHICFVFHWVLCVVTFALDISWVCSGHTHRHFSACMCSNCSNNTCLDLKQNRVSHSGCYTLYLSQMQSTNRHLNRAYDIQGATALFHFCCCFTCAFSALVSNSRRMCPRKRRKRSGSPIAGNSLFLVHQKHSWSYFSKMQQT
jgi:hypothetical protein